MAGQAITDGVHRREANLTGHLVRAVENEMSRQTGRYYQIGLDKLDRAELENILLMLRDLADERRRAVVDAQKPWRRSSDGN